MKEKDSLCDMNPVGMNMNFIPQAFPSCHLFRSLFLQAAKAKRQTFLQKTLTVACLCEMGRKSRLRQRN